MVALRTITDSEKPDDGRYSWWSAYRDDVGSRKNRKITIAYGAVHAVERLRNVESEGNDFRGIELI